MAMDKEEKDKVIILLAMCKLMKIEAFPGAVYGALEDAEHEVTFFDQATDVDLSNQPQ